MSGTTADAVLAASWTQTAKQLRHQATQYAGIAQAIPPNPVHQHLASTIQDFLQQQYRDMATYLTEKADYAQTAAYDYARHGRDGVVARQMNTDNREANAVPFGTERIDTAEAPDPVEEHDTNPARVA